MRKISSFKKLSRREARDLFTKGAVIRVMPRDVPPEFGDTDCDFCPPMQWENRIPNFAQNLKWFFQDLLERRVRQAKRSKRRARLAFYVAL